MLRHGVCWNRSAERYGFDRRARQAFGAALGEAVPLLKTRPRELALGAELAQRFAALLLFENARNKTF
jgi:hypothetical protein